MPHKCMYRDILNLEKAIACFFCKKKKFQNSFQAIFKILFADVNIRTKLTNKTLHCTTNINESATIKEIVIIYKNQYMYLYACLHFELFIAHVHYTDSNDISQIISQQIKTTNRH